MRSLATLLMLWLALTLAACSQNTLRRPDMVKAGQVTQPNLGFDHCMWSGNRLDSDKFEADNPHWDALASDQHPNPYLRDPYARSGDGCRTHSVEVTKRYKMFFVEFDEQGRLYDDRQMSQLFDYLEHAVGCQNKDLSIVTFVHGWRHNAQADDNNVRLAREILSFTYLGEHSGSHPNTSYKRDTYEFRCKTGTRSPAIAGAREVVGIYVGWRGKSLTAGKLPVLNTLLESITVWDRKNTAENVAIGSTRELFSRLRAFQSVANRGESDCAAPQADSSIDQQFQCRRVRLLLIGHSFGGLIVYNAIAPALLDSLSQGFYSDPTIADNCRETAGADIAYGPGSALVRSFADLIILINPAVEGARFEPLHQAVQRRQKNANGPGGFCPNQKPILVAITARNDLATRYAFTVARTVSTILEDRRPVGLQPDPELTSASGQKPDPSQTPNPDLKPDPDPQPPPDGRTIEQFRNQEESDASRSAIGHVNRYVTHKIKGIRAITTDSEQNDKEFAKAFVNYCQEKQPDGAEQLLQMCRCGVQAGPGPTHRTWEEFVREQVSAKFDPAAKSDPAAGLSCPAYVEELNIAQMYQLKDGGPQWPWYVRGNQFIFARNGWRQTFCGGVTVNHLADYSPDSLFLQSQKAPDWAKIQHAPNTPIWIVQSDDATVLDGHSDIHEPLKAMLQQLYHSISVAQFNKEGFEAIEKQALGKVKLYCAKR